MAARPALRFGGKKPEQRDRHKARLMAPFALAAKRKTPPSGKARAPLLSHPLCFQLKKQLKKESF
jgi:hypothetical protein